MIVETEKQTAQEKSPLLPGHKLLFPNPGFLGGAAFRMTQEMMGKPDASYSELDHELVMANLDKVMGEYFSILSLLDKHVSRENIVLVQNSMTMAKRDSLTAQLNFESADFQFQEFENIKLQAFISHPEVWPRDGFMTIGPLTFIHPVYFQDAEESKQIKKSSLAEGGMALHAKNVVLVSELLWYLGKRGLDKGFKILKNFGIIIAPLPPVNPSKQLREPHPTHIDSHAALIVDKSDNLYLLAAQSYSRQGKGTLKKIRFAAETIDAKIFEIDDRKLPPLALNFIQFVDKSVIVTGSETADLTFVLQDLLGKEKVLITEKPIVAVPAILGGGIRCMVNTLPTSVINSLTIAD